MTLLHQLKNLLPNEPLVEVDYNDYTIAELQSILDDRNVPYNKGELKAYYVDLAERSEPNGR